MTAAGPFLYLARRFVRRLPNYPKIGDRLWACLGLPWLVTALLQSATPGTEPRHNPLFSATLIVGSGGRVPYCTHRCLGHLGHGSAGPGREGGSGAVDQSPGPDPVDRLADSMRTRDGCLKLSEPMLASREMAVVSRSSSKISWRLWSGMEWPRCSSAPSGALVRRGRRWGYRERGFISGSGWR